MFRFSLGFSVVLGDMVSGLLGVLVWLIVLILFFFFACFYTFLFMICFKLLMLG